MVDSGNDNERQKILHDKNHDRSLEVLAEISRLMVWLEKNCVDGGISFYLPAKNGLFGKAKYSQDRFSKKNTI